MSNILLIGKDLPDGLDFSEGLTKGENQVYTVARTDSESSNFESEKIYASTWNKSSAVSAHSLVIKAETKLTNIDNIIFFFDSSYFCTKFKLDKTEEIASAVDFMFNSFFYSTSEILKRIDQRKEKVSVTFLVKEYPSKNDVIINSKVQNVVPSSSIVSAAQAAFCSIAENFAANISDRDYLSVILAKCSYNNELYKNDKAIAEWCLDSYLTLDGQKNKQSLKNAANWNKVGSKIQTGFRLF